MKPTYVMFDESVTRRDMNAVIDSLTHIFSLLGQEKSLIKNFGIWRSQHMASPTGMLNDYESIDWYIEKCWNKRRSQVNGSNLLNLCLIEPWQRANPHYDVVVTGRDLWDGESTTNFVVGLAAKGFATVISTARFQGTDVMWSEVVKTEIYHEVGHVFGLVPDGRPNSAQVFGGNHCTNICVMRQGMIVPIDWIDLTRDRIRQKAPYCPQCLENLHEYVKSLD